MTIQWTNQSLKQTHVQTDSKRGKTARSVYSLVLIGWQGSASSKSCPITQHQRSWEAEILAGKRIKCFPLELRRKKIEKATNTGHFGVFKKTRWGKSHDCRHLTVFEKLHFQNVLKFLFTLKRQGWRFQIPQVLWTFRIATFTRRISVDGRSVCRKEAAFLNFPGLVWV